MNCGYISLTSSLIGAPECLALLPKIQLRSVLLRLERSFPNGVKVSTLKKQCKKCRQYESVMIYTPKQNIAFTFYLTKFLNVKLLIKMNHLSHLCGIQIIKASSWEQWLGRLLYLTISIRYGNFYCCCYKGIWMHCLMCWKSNRTRKRGFWKQKA